MDEITLVQRQPALVTVAGKRLAAIGEIDQPLDVGLVGDVDD